MNEIISLDERRRRKATPAPPADPWIAVRDKIRAEYVTQYDEETATDLLTASSHLTALAGLLTQALAAQLDAAARQRQMAIFYAQVSILWRRLGLGTFAVFDAAVTAAVGDAESRPPRAPVAWRLASITGDVGQVADLATCWWGAALDDYRAQIEPVFANLGCKVRELWTVLG